MCKTRVVNVEVIESAEGKRTYVIREFVGPQQPPATLAVLDSGEEVAQFLVNLKID